LHIWKNEKKRKLIFGNSFTLVTSIVAVPVVFAHSAFYADKANTEIFFLSLIAILTFFHSIAGVTLLKNKRSLKSYNVYCYVQFCFYLIGMFTYYKWADRTCQRRNQLLPLVTCYGLSFSAFGVIFNAYLSRKIIRTQHFAKTVPREIFSDSFQNTSGVF